MRSLQNVESSTPLSLASPKQPERSCFRKENNMKKVAVADWSKLKGKDPAHALVADGGLQT
jgi:hypothetical protein